MDAGSMLRSARGRAGLSQADLAARAGTSQATISAYESGSKQPSVATFSRLLAAAGARLTVEEARRPVTEPSPADVITLAEALPARRARKLRYPRLGRAA